MTDTANSSQFEAWNGDSGRRWVASADERDKVLAPVADALLAAAAPSPGPASSTSAADAAPPPSWPRPTSATPGSATGIDLSAPMLDLARQRATAAGATNTNFMHADAQTHGFEPDSIDLVISRFGTMFFSDPDAAFINIGTALRPGGRLCLATWQPLAANEWLTVPGAALLRHTDLPATTPDEPGMFAQSDPELVTATLTAAGLIDITIEARDVTFTIGQTIDEAVEYLADSGPGRALLETIPEGPARDAALADVRDALVDHHDDSGVRLGGGIWLITATSLSGLRPVPMMTAASAQGGTSCAVRVLEWLRGWRARRRRAPRFRPGRRGGRRAGLPCRLGASRLPHDGRGDDGRPSERPVPARDRAHGSRLVSRVAVLRALAHGDRHRARRGRVAHASGPRRTPGRAVSGGSTDPSLALADPGTSSNEPRSRRVTVSGSANGTRSATRAPRYVQGKRGHVVRLDGVFSLPDVEYHCDEKRSEPTYSVRFEADELWGEPGDPVHVDLWESYLEPDEG